MPPKPHWSNNGAIAQDVPIDALRQAIFKTVTWKDDNGVQYFKSQSLWIAIYNVLQHYGLVPAQKGTMRQFATLMSEEWMTTVASL